MSNVLMQCPTVQLGTVYTTQNASYAPNTSGIISVLPVDVPQLLLSGCTFADLTGAVATSTAAAIQAARIAFVAAGVLGGLFSVWKITQ